MAMAECAFPLYCAMKIATWTCSRHFSTERKID